MAHDPELETFLAALDAEIAPVAPATMVAIFGGLRRSARLAGIDPQSKAYVPWLRNSMLACFDLLFRQGIRHIIAPLAIGTRMVETTAVRDQLLAGINWGFAGPEALADYNRYGWRVRLIGAESIPKMAATAERLRVATSATSQSTLWFSICADVEMSLQATFDTALQTGARTRSELIRALYGEDIPLATMLIGFGKPAFSYDLVPPLLVGRLQCYWMQRPGYSLDRQMLRQMLYDYAYTRQTGSGSERNGRYANIQAQRAAWETDWVLGVGVQLGAFWYPAPFAGPPKA